MTYSFKEVFPYLFENYGDEIKVKEDIFDEDDEIDFYMDELLSGTIGQIVINIPNFTGLSYNNDTEEKTFEAKIFRLNSRKRNNELHDACDGSATYSDYLEVEDIDSGEYFEIEAYYYSSDYPHLQFASIKEIEPQEEHSEDSFFVALEVKKTRYIVHGIFFNISLAVKACESIGKTNVVIEEVPQNTQLIKSKNGSSILNSATAQYDINGEIIEYFED